MEAFKRTFNRSMLFFGGFGGATLILLWTNTTLAAEETQFPNPFQILWKYFLAWSFMYAVSLVIREVYANRKRIATLQEHIDELKQSIQQQHSGKGTCALSVRPSASLHLF